MTLRTICRCGAALAAGTLTLLLTVGTAWPAPAPGAKTGTARAKTAPAAAAAKPSTAAAAAIAKTAPATTAPSRDAADSTDGGKQGGYTLKGGQERTDFRSLTVEGEDRVHVEIERPPLALQMNPAEVKGLDFGTAQDVLDRTAPDLTSQYLAVSATGRSPYTARPWLRQFATGAVARFQPSVRGTERWKLTVADSHGQTAAQFSGSGDPPREIVWDGRTISGAQASPGITYSYVFEAVDKAGNKRNFVGQGFKVASYRMDPPSGPVLVFSGQSLQEGVARNTYGPGAASRPAPPIVLEAASDLNQSSRGSQPVRVTVVGRSYEQANATAKQVASWISDLTIGDPARVLAVAEVQPDAPEGGTVRIAIADGPGMPGAVQPAAAPGKPGKDSKKSKR